MQTRDWCFTINNPEESDIASTFGLWENELCTYIVYQYERGEEGTLHMQGFVQMKAKTRLLRMSRLLARAHIEARFKKSTPQQAADYCKKEEGRVEGPFEFGELDNTTQGKRTDLEEIHELCKSHTSIPDMMEKYTGTVIRNLKNIKEVRNMYIPPRDFKTEVTVIWGFPGTGKTYWAMHAFQRHSR